MMSGQIAQTSDQRRGSPAADPCPLSRVTGPTRGGAPGVGATWQRCFHQPGSMKGPKTVSAFLVSDKHINVMLTAGMRVSPYGPLHWQAPDHHYPETVTLTETHERGAVWGTDSIALATLLDRTLTHETSDQVGAILLAANMESVNYRYDEHDLEPIYRYRPDPVTPVAALKAIDCYEYQACEPPSWQHSEARAICQELRQVAIQSLPGYHEAPWAH